MLKRILMLGLLAPGVQAMDPFPQPIVHGPLTVKISDFANVPNSLGGSPARMSVLSTDPQGRLFVNDQRGALYRLPDSGGSAQSFLNLNEFATNPVVSTAEAGFQSFAFHPDFANVGTAGYGRIYTMHSTSNTSPSPDFDPGGLTSFHSVLLEWRTEDHSAETFIAAQADSPFREIMRLDQPFGNHNTGLIAFNPDAAGGADHGNLYIAVGDGGAGGDPQNNGQTLSNPYGAILRIDPLGTNSANGNYGIVDENVFASDPVAANTLGEIYAAGLRNPQRFGWDASSGEMYIADIGQGSVEEVDRGVNGGNYGWREREGSLPFNDLGTMGFIDPVAEYDHTNLVSDPPSGISNRAVTLGEVLRASEIDGLNGKLLLGDFPTGLIFTLDVDDDPLDGGQDGLFELRLVDENFDEVRLLDLINRERTANGLPLSSRADLRFGFNTAGRVFVLNKHDGVVRELTSVPLPAPIGAFVVALVLMRRLRVLHSGEASCVAKSHPRAAF